MSERRHKRRWKRIAFRAAAFAAVVLVALVAVGPMVTSRFAPGFIEAAANGSIHGTVEVERVSLSWFGPQQIGPVTLRDPEGGTVGAVEARVGAGLLGLALGGRDVGDVSVSGNVDVVRGVDGRTNLERAVEGREARRASEPGGPVRVPRGLAARVNLDDLNVTYRDEASGASVAVSGFGGIIEVRSGLEVAGELTGRVEARGESGTLTITLAAGGLTDEAGLVSAERAEAEASVLVEGLPVAIADELAGQGVLLSSVLGENVSGRIEFGYAGGEARVDASLSTPNSSLELGLAGTRERAYLTRALAASLRTEGVPGAYLERFGRELVDPSVASIGSMPAVEVRVDEAAARVPAGGVVDLRGARISGSISTTAMEVREAGGRRLRVEPMTLSFGSAGLDGVVRVAGSTEAMIDGNRAGEISLEASAEGVLDQAGALRATGPTGLTGVLRVAGLELAVLQPFVSALGVDLAREIGRTVSLEVTAEAVQVDGGSSVVVGISGAAEHLGVTGEARGRGSAWEVTRTVEARLGQPGGLISPLASRAGVRIDGASGAAIRIEEGSRMDLAAGVVSIRAALMVDEVRATFGVGESVHALAVRGARATAFADGSGSVGGEVQAGLSLDGHAIERFTMSATLEGNPLREFDLASAKAMGRVEVVGVPAALLQRFVPEASLDVRHVVGAGMDLAVTVEPGDGGATAGLPASVVTVAVKSSAATGGGVISIADGVISTVGDGVMLRGLRYGALAREHLAAAGIETAPDAIGSVRVFDVRVPLGEGLRPELHASSASLEVGSTTLWVEREGVERVGIPRLIFGGSLAAAGTARVWLDATMEQGGSSFWAGGDMTVPRLVRFDGGRISLNTEFVPTGGLKVRDVPVSVLGIASGMQVGGRSLAEIAREALGRTASLELAVARQPGVASSSVSVRFDSARTDLSATAYILPGEYRVGNVSLESEVSPGLVNPFLGSAGGPALRGATRVSAGLLGPIVVPRVGFGVDLSGVQGCRYSVAMPGRAMVGGIDLVAGDGTARVLEDAGFENVLVEGWAPLKALAGEGSGNLAGRISATLVDGDGRARGMVTGEFMAPLAGRALSGSSKVVVGVTGLETSWADALLAGAGFVSGAVGPTLDVQTETWIAPASAGEARGIERLSTTMTATSARLVTGEAIRVRYLPDRITVAAPAVSWTAPAEWLNTHVLGAESAVRFGEAFRLEAAVRSLSLSRGEGMLRPGVFGVDASLSSPRVVISAEGGGATVLTDVTAGARSREGGVDVSVSAMEGVSRLTVAARATKYADGQGRATFGAMTLTGDASLPGISVALLDGLLKQKGLLVDALGDKVSATASFRGFSREGGTLSASLRSPRAEADISGRARGGVFVADGQPTFKLLEVTPELAARVYKGLPAIGRFEKRRDSGPAIVTLTGLEAPLDGNLERLQGVVRFEPGVAHFETAGRFQKILRALDQRQAGVAGRRLEPLVVRITNGVARYEPYTIPLGEFNVRSEGSVDLVQRRLDVVTWIPFGALSDEAAGAFSLDLGKAVGGLLPPLERLSMVPFRTRGPLASPTTGPDMEMFVKQMLRPDQLLLPNLGKIFGGGLN